VNAFIKFNRGLLVMPLPWRLWLLLLLALNLAAPLVFIEQLEAQATLAALLVSMALMTGLKLLPSIKYQPTMKSMYLITGSCSVASTAALALSSFPDIVLISACEGSV
jgi:hypothetical protein